MELNKYDIWSEGFIITGQSSGANKLNKEPIEAESFEKAIKEFKRNDPNINLYSKRENGTWTYWGCELFDNEADARKAFG